MGIIQRMLGGMAQEPDEPNDNDSDNKEYEQGEGDQYFEDRVRGKITRVDERGFGFITSKEIPFTRIFFHWSGLLQSTRNFKDLTTGLFVEFNPLLTKDKGYRALKIEVIDDLLDNN